MNNIPTREIVPNGLDPGYDLSRVIVAHGHAVVTPLVLGAAGRVVQDETRRHAGHSWNDSWWTIDSVVLASVDLAGYPGTVVRVAGRQDVGQGKRPSS